MDSKVFVSMLLCLAMGINLVNCAKTKKIEDSAFLEDAASKYSPELIKSLLLNRIDHKIGQIKVVSGSVGINEKQSDLCNVMIKSFNVLKSDVQLMDETQVICDDGTYDETIKGFINQFAMLTETFNQEYDFLRVPDVTNNTPSALSTAHTLGLFSLSQLTEKLTKGIGDFKADIKSKEEAESENGLIKVLAAAVVRQFDALISDVKTFGTDSKMISAIDRFDQVISIFYRQYGILTSQSITNLTIPQILSQQTYSPDSSFKLMNESDKTKNRAH